MYFLIIKLKKLVNYTNKQMLKHHILSHLLLVSRNGINRQNTWFWFIILLSIIFSYKISAQDPSLPPTNLGMVNVFDGMGGKPGFVYQGYVQVFQTQNVIGDRGQDMHSDLKINSLVQVNQIIFQTPLKVFGGDLGFMLMIPVVQITTSNSSGPAPTVNPGVLGDITQGISVQWSGKKLFDKPFSHRMELNATLPVGSYDEKYNINPSSHAYTFSTYHAFTIMLNNHVSISIRNQFNYNTRTIGQEAKAGSFYNGNYTIDYAILPNLRVEAVSYFLAQINQDSYDGNSHYYQQQFGISDTRERVFGYGVGLVYFSKGGALIEVKTFFETAAKNRVEGYRPSLRLTIPLN